ncbi:hypothetical protein KSS87_013288 [Heliosperma pusillum]|nr:hypothetical protein KSS87_013288 [Heliosperma pusillum]
MAEHHHQHTLTLSTPLLTPNSQFPNTSTNHNHEDHTINIQEPTSQNPQIDHQNPYSFLGYVATKTALYGWKDRHNPMPRWRSRLIYQWIKRKGRPASREIAPIVVSNHVSYIDPIFYFYELFSSIVSSDSHDSIPFVGTIIRAMQVIYVNRFSPASRKNAINEIKVEYLPVVPPLRNQKENAADFAERTANAMATALNVVQTSYGYGDMLLLNKAVEMKKENPSRFMAELAHADLSYRISTVETLEFLEKFLSMNPDNNGCVNIDSFVGALKLKHCDLSKKIVAFVFSEKGEINFKQFLLASTRVMNQPLFQRACEFSFSKCSDDEHEYVSREKFGDAIREAIPDASDSDVILLFNTFDVDGDGDGRVSKHDFLKCLRKNPLLIALFSPLLQDEFSHTSNGLLELEEIIC